MTGGGLLDAVTATLQFRDELDAARVAVAFTTDRGTVELVAAADEPLRITVDGDEVPRTIVS